MGNMSKKAHWLNGERIYKKTKNEIWNKLKERGKNLSDEFVHQINRNLKDPIQKKRRVK